MAAPSAAMAPQAPDPAGGAPIVSLSGVSKRFESGTVALSGVDLSVERGEFLSLLGPSGCGKSTILRLVAGLDTPTSGRIEWADRGRPRDVGFVFQEPTLMPWARVFENVWLPLRLKGMSRAEAEPRITEALESVGLTEFHRAYPRELSGGMKMRVSIARALATDPTVLLMDEPFAALDEITRFKLNDDLLRLWKERGWTILFVTHSVFESVYLSTRIAVMTSRPGRIESTIAIDEPSPRSAEFRMSPHYADLARTTSDALSRAPRPTPCRARWASHDRPGGSMTGGPMSADRGPDDIPGERSAAAEAVSTVPVAPGAPVDPGPAIPMRRRLDRALRIVLPLVVVSALIYAWQYTVEANEIPPYILPSPERVLQTLIEERGLLLPSLVTTLTVTIAALILAVIGGVLLAIVLTQSRIIEYSIFPIAVVVQVTPIVAIFPLINIYIDNHLAKILLCAWIIAFFPILSNTTLGLMSADQNLKDLYRLYGASRWQRLRHLLLPAALPYFLGGLRISGGLALVGAVVAEFVAGTSGFGSGLATRIIEAGYQLKIPRLFAALGLISASGVAIYVILSVVSNLILGKWHESAMEGRR